VGYIIERATSPNGPYTFLMSVTETTYTDIGLNLNKTNSYPYYYEVAAVNAAGSSTNSIVSVSTGPPAPSSLTATPGNTLIMLNWSASSGTTSYTLKCGLSSGNENTNVVTGYTGTSYTNSSLVNGTTYYYVVTASGSGGASTNSPEASATPQVPPPAAPTGLSAIASNTRVALNWNPSSNATGYNVKNATVTGGPYTVIASNVTSTVYTDTTVVAGTRYYYVVSALNAGGESTNSTEASAYVLSPLEQWQMNYFGCTNCAQAAPDADPLGKGISNTNQFLLGLNPTNAASVFRILSAVQQTTDVVITWATAGVRTNAVQATAGDANGGYTTNFSDISGSIIIPVSGDMTTNYTDVGGATNTPSRYYRIRLVQ
jgi:hypothetical protein